MLKNKTEIVNILKTKSRLTCLINTTRKVEKKISLFYFTCKMLQQGKNWFILQTKMVHNCSNPMHSDVAAKNLRFV